MDRDRFEAIVAAYGADSRRWPAGEREAALRFVAGDDDLADARALDALLALAPSPPPPSDLLVARVLREAARSRQSNLAPAIALAACMVMGVIVGFGVGLRAPSGEDVDWMLTAAFEAPDSDWIEGEL
ncbi:MAG: hypothetical protein H7124_09610 [Phycisphaerales bacterium]|nr:hypothetical protein [Hyphomonadaceae bacterium]